MPTHVRRIESTLIYAQVIIMTGTGAHVDDNLHSVYRYLMALQRSMNDDWQSLAVSKKPVTPGSSQFALQAGTITKDIKIVRPVLLKTAEVTAISVVTKAAKGMDLSQYPHLSRSLQIEAEFGKNVKVVRPLPEDVLRDYLAKTREVAQQDAEYSKLVQQLPPSDCMELLKGAETASTLDDVNRCADSAVRCAINDPSYKAIKMRAHIAKAFGYYRYGMYEKAREHCIDACEVSPGDPTFVVNISMLTLGKAQTAWSARTMSAEAIENLLLDRMTMTRRYIQLDEERRGKNHSQSVEAEATDLMRFYIASGNLEKAAKIATEFPALNALYKQVGKPEFIGRLSW